MPTAELEKKRPIYERIERSIGDKVKSGEFKPGQCIGTTAEIASKWGVSGSTVRYLLQGLTAKGVLVRKPGVGTFVSDKLTVDDRAVSNRSDGVSVSLLLPDISVHGYSRLARGIQSAATEDKLDLIVSSTDDNTETYDAIIRRHIRAGVLGFIIVPPVHQPLSVETINEIHKNNVFGVSCYRPSGYAGWPVLMTNRLGGFKIGVKHFCEIGKKRIAFFSNNSEETQDYFMSKSGFIEGLLDCELSIDKKLLVGFGVCDFGKLMSEQEILARTEEKVAPWLKEHSGMDAIFCNDDFLATTVVRILKQLGKKVPDDVAVIGQGNLGVGHSGELTTIDGCFNEMGKEAFKLLLERKKGKEFPSNHVIKLESQLIIGRSTVKS